MVQVAEPYLLISLLGLFLVQAIGAHFATVYGSPRAYFVISTGIGAVVFWMLLITSPQLFPQLAG